MSIARVVVALAFALGFVIAGSSTADAQVWKLKKSKSGATTPKKSKPAAARSTPTKKKAPARPTRKAAKPKRKLDLTGDSASDDDRDDDRDDAPPPTRQRFARSEDDDPVEVTVEELD